MLLVGLDAASKPENFGFALGELERGRIALREFGMLRTTTMPDALSAVVAPELERAQRALIAIDAPLGWPAALARSLIGHRAGEPISADKEELFWRETDRAIAAANGKRPLEVGADKIARAAHTAVAEIGRLRKLTRRPIPLVWSPKFEGLAAIEVYPAATLKAHGLPDAGYKKGGEADRAVRRRIAEGLHGEMPELADLIDERADVFDACLCLIAAKDFLEGETLRPTNDELAQQEGWIWVRTTAR